VAALAVLAGGEATTLGASWRETCSALRRELVDRNAGKASHAVEQDGVVVEEQCQSQLRVGIVLGRRIAAASGVFVGGERFFGKLVEALSNVWIFVEETLERAVLELEFDLAGVLSLDVVRCAERLKFGEVDLVLTELLERLQVGDRLVELRG
jgi:hypothetical protein